jgi:hypothetical protein
MTLRRGTVHVIVHAGAYFSSAKEQIDHGDLDFAIDDLRTFIQEAESLVVIDGMLSDAIPQNINTLIDDALNRAAAAGLPALRVWGCDSGELPYPKWAGRGGYPIYGSQSEAADPIAYNLRNAQKIICSGAWATRDGSEGCVNDVADTLRDRLPHIDIEVSPDALYVENTLEAPELGA